jgi:prepilin-type N-terminal cleavage/methylation domain-containing protein
MKLLRNQPSRQSPIWLTIVRAFTLTEMMTTMAVFGLVVVAMVSLQIFGFKINSLTSNKLASTGDSLKALDQIRIRILGATNQVLIGNFNTSNNKFTALAYNSLAIGNAVQISNSPTSLVTFYLNTNANRLYGLGNTANSQPTALTHPNIINLQPFQAEDCLGHTNLVGSSGHYTIKMTLLFSNLLYSLPTPFYDTYRLESRATPREQF